MTMPVQPRSPSRSVLPPGLTTHPVRGFKDYFYFGTKKICLATRRRAHVPRTDDDQDDDAEDEWFRCAFRLPASSSSWEFIAPSMLCPSFPLSHSSSGVRRKTEGKEGRGEAEDKSKRVSKAAARRVGVSVTRDGQEVVRKQHLCFTCTRRISTTNAGPEDR